MVFLEISQIWQENTCDSVSSTLLKKRLWYRCFPGNFVKFLRTTFFYRTPPGDCFWISKAMLKFWFIFHIQNLWCNFTRDNSFLQTPWQPLNGKQKNASLSPSRHIKNTTALMCIISSILNCSYVNQTNLVINRWKYRSKGLLKAIFCYQKNYRKRRQALYELELKKWVFYSDR